MDMNMIVDCGNDYNLYEVWKPIIGFEGSYEISSYGNVKTLSKRVISAIHSSGYRMTKEKALKKVLNKNGYLYITISKNNKAYGRSVHRLVAIHFIANPNNCPEVNHINTIKTDNHISNLEWNTSVQNTQHAFITGHKASRVKLSIDKIIKIRELHLSGKLSNKEIGNIYNIKGEAVRRVIIGETWKF